MNDTSEKPKVLWGDCDDDEYEKINITVATIADNLALVDIVKSQPIINDDEATIEEEINDGGVFPPRCEEFRSIPRISESALKGIESMGFDKPKQIQRAALPFILQDPPRNLVAQAINGSGKTAAFLIAAILRCELKEGVNVIVVSHSRELADQNYSVACKLSKFSDVKVGLAVTDRFEKSKIFTEQIVSGTGGVLTGLIRNRKLSCDNLKMLILDEADELLGEDGQREQMVQLQNLIIQTRSKRNLGAPQIILFSATYNDSVTQFIRKHIGNPNKLRVKREDLNLKNVLEFRVETPSSDVQDARKFNLLSAIYRSATLGQTIIFCNMKVTCSKLAKRMTDAGHTVSLFSGDLSSNDRDDAIKLFRDGKTKVLISSDLLSRGVDFDSVNLVVNYDIPYRSIGNRRISNPETYLHRVGRAGRNGRRGVAINFVDFETKKVLDEIVGYFNKTLSILDENAIENDLADILEKHLNP